MNSFFYRGQKLQQEPASFYMDANGKPEEKHIQWLAGKVRDLLSQTTAMKEDIVVICIGSDRYIGDALGPLVGTMLQEKNLPVSVYGTLEEPIHAFNLNGVLKKIDKRKSKPVIIGIDASLGEREQVGHVMFKNGPLIPGRALKKMLPEVGDFHFAGFVNYVDPLPESQFLNDTRLFTVMNLAHAITDVLTEVFVKDN